MIRATHHTWSGSSLAHGWPCALHTPATSQKCEAPACSRVATFALDREAGQCTPRAIGCPRQWLPRRKKFGAGGTLTQGHTSNTVGKEQVKVTVVKRLVRNNKLLSLGVYYIQWKLCHQQKQQRQ